MERGLLQRAFHLHPLLIDATRIPERSLGALKHDLKLALSYELSDDDRKAAVITTVDTVFGTKYPWLSEALSFLFDLLVEVQVGRDLAVLDAQDELEQPGERGAHSRPCRAWQQRGCALSVHRRPGRHLGHEAHAVDALEVVVTLDHLERSGAHADASASARAKTSGSCAPETPSRPSMT